MKYKEYYILFLLAFFVSCKSKIKIEEKTEGYLNVNKAITSDSLSEEEPSYEELVRGAYNELLDSYHKIKTIDSLFIVENDTFHLVMKYRCLLDSKIVVPKSYIEPYMEEIKEDFVTHNFVIDTKLYKNSRLYINKEFTKNYFLGRIKNEEVEKYGILLAPEIENTDHNILISISITIPATDVGIGITDTLRLK